MPAAGLLALLLWITRLVGAVSLFFTVWSVALLILTGLIPAALSSTILAIVGLTLPGLAIASATAAVARLVTRAILLPPVAF